MPGPLRLLSAFLVAALPLLLILPSQPAAQGFAEALKNAEAARADSLRKAGLPPDPGATPTQGATPAGAPADTSRQFLPPQNHRWASPYDQSTPCPVALEHASLCWRQDKALANQDIGYPAARGWTLSQETLEPVPMASPYFPGWKNSPYLNGGLLPPDAYVLETRGGRPISIEQPFAPVVPLDTPVTSLEWERGAMALNLFHLQLRRMLGGKVYFAIDYYSATADSQSYDYQFNVHQPYLGGWGFLGSVYPPIDRDSLSIVTGGVSAGLEALNFRPRVGFWLDTNQVLEAFMDRVKNQSALAFPRRPGADDSTGEADSLQSLMSSSFSAYTGGLVHGWSAAGWSSQWELAASALEKETPWADSASRASAAAMGSKADAWEGSQFRLRGRVAAPGWFLGPFVEAEALSEIWDGALRLGGGYTGVTQKGWTDRQSLRAGIRTGAAGPEWLNAEIGGGMARSSRMDNTVRWLPQGAASLSVDLPFRFDAEAGLDYEARDPDWEILYRGNPALFRHASPRLLPKEDLGYRGEVTFALPFLRLGAGAAYQSTSDAWLPGVLPAPDACAALADSAYAYAAPCAGILVPDSLALGLRNWDTLRRFSWHMLLGFDLGHWSLDLRNRFHVLSEAEDAAVDGAFNDGTVPARIFKGDLGWKRDLLDGRLQVAVGWGWEWYSTRYAWVPNLEGASAARKLDEYLALDFGASMRIKTFLLFFKGMNFNHDRYATEPGVHPPGVNFRFGIDWTLTN